MCVCVCRAKRGGKRHDFCFTDSVFAGYMMIYTCTTDNMARQQIFTTIQAYLQAVAKASEIDDGKDFSNLFSYKVISKRLGYQFARVCIPHDSYHYCMVGRR